VELALNNRELAVLIWVATGFVWVLSRCETRVWIWRIIVAYLHPQMLATLLALAAYAVGLVWLGEHGGLWDTSLINDTIIWFVTVALVLHLNSNQISGDRHFLRRRFGQAVAGTVLIEGLVNLFVLPLPVELFLFPFLFFLVAMSAVAEMKEETAVAAHVANAVLGIIGIGLVVFVVVKLVTGFGDADWAHVGRVLFLPVWLTVGLLPAVYALGFYAACDSTFRRIGFFGDKVGASRQARRRAKLALLLGTRLRAPAIRQFTGLLPRRLVSAGSLKDARQIVAKFCMGQRQEDAFPAPMKEPT
jgi:hypothetical protein